MEFGPLGIIGLGYLINTFAKPWLWGFWKHVLRPRRDLLGRYGKDSWAVVTGASDGIGEALCYQLARSGLNIVLVSRSEDKLKKVE